MALVVLEYLSGYKGGLMKHLYFRKMEHMYSIYTETGMAFHTVVLLLLLFVMVLLVRQSNWQAIGIRCLTRLSTGSLVLVSLFYLPWFQGLVVYTYALMVIEGIIIIEMLKIISLTISRKI